MGGGGRGGEASYEDLHSFTWTMLPSWAADPPQVGQTLLPKRRVSSPFSPNAFLSVCQSVFFRSLFRSPSLPVSLFPSFSAAVLIKRQTDGNGKTIMLTTHADNKQNDKDSNNHVDRAKNVTTNQQ